MPNLRLGRAGIFSKYFSSLTTSNVREIKRGVVRGQARGFLPPQTFVGATTNGHQLKLQFSGTPNYPYILRAATNLTPPVNWQPVLTNPADANGNWQFTATNLNGGQKFYRALGQ